MWKERLTKVTYFPSRPNSSLSATNARLLLPKLADNYRDYQNDQDGDDCNGYYPVCAHPKIRC